MASIQDTLAAQPAQAQAPAQAPVQEQAPAQGQDLAAEQNAEQTSDVTPEEQEIYDKVVSAGIRTINEGPTSDSLLEVLKQGAETPAETISTAATSLLTQMDDATGGAIPADMISPIAEEFLHNIAEFVEASGVMKVDEQIVSRAMQLMTIALIEEYGGSQEEAEEFINSFTQDEVDQARIMQQKIEETVQ